MVSLAIHLIVAPPGRTFDCDSRMHSFLLFAYLSRRLVGELIVYPWSGVRPSSVVVHNFKHEYLCNQCADHNEILSEASLGWGKAALGFGPDWIKTLVSMATDSSHRVIMEKTILPLFSSPEPKAHKVSL